MRELKLGGWLKSILGWLSMGYDELMPLPLIFLAAHALFAVPTRAPVHSEFNKAEALKVITEAKDHSRVYEQLSYLATHIGPRVTGSPQLMAADEWAMKVMKGYGLSNVHLEQWGTVPVGFWRGPKSEGKILHPYESPITFSTNNWTAGTHGAVKGPAVVCPKTAEEVRSMAKLLKGAWVLMPTVVGMGGPRNASEDDLAKALDEAKIAGRVYSSQSELVWSHGNYFNIDPKKLPTRIMVQVAKPDFDTIKENLAKNVPVEVEFNVDNRWTKAQPVYNVVGELPGTDLADQVVVVGGHFDSWNTPGSQGAMDNGTGSMVAMEVGRVLKMAGVSHRRTLRVILYSGEEEGLLGSQGYVKSHVKDLDHIVAALNDDGGTNAETGFTLLKGSEAIVAPIQELVDATFPDVKFHMNFGDKLPVGGSDHGSFVEGGVPAVEFNKSGKPVSYRYIWHTQNDNIKNVDRPSLEESATVSSIVMYVLLNSDQTLPRPTSQRTVK
jgi:hypothetical protein